jgi:hypothetical protein
MRKVIFFITSLLAMGLFTWITMAIMAMILVWTKISLYISISILLIILMFFIGHFFAGIKGKNKVWIIRGSLTGIFLLIIYAVYWHYHSTTVNHSLGIILIITYVVVFSSFTAGIMIPQEKLLAKIKKNIF